MAKRQWIVTLALSTFFAGSFSSFGPVYSTAHALNTEETPRSNITEDIQSLSSPDIFEQNDSEGSHFEETQFAVTAATYDPTAFLTLFDKDKIVHNFRSMHKVFPSRIVRNDLHHVYKFKKALRKVPNFTYTYNGQARTFKDLLQRTGTTGLLVLENDKILIEKYYQGNTPKSLATSWSISKSITSALIGIAIDEGHIKNVNDPITDYLPELKQSGYNGVSIKHILNMASGVKYPNFDNEFMKVWHQELFVDKKSFNHKMTGLPADTVPSGTFVYKGSDTQVLGMLLLKVTGKHPSKYLEEKIWKPLGMESVAKWNTDMHGDDMTFAFLNATVRDYAKIGRLYLNNGNWNGKQIVSENWIKETYIASEGSPFYKYQWWIPMESNGTEIIANGIYGQTIYVNQKENIVLIKTSTDTVEEGLEEIVAFREIIRVLKQQPIPTNESN
ncbi:serine hydrolase domain-containing protein [Paenibacillus sp. 481]|uniref:serine hydrolase domain-containing protein n=1 Tax=Paenibacillus sp. 481 TaxID=2835869 RepID=UPI001E2F4BF5|nr:serine hydrolase [Paenibacillus sp. 481]UHA71831.1 serine hydrolase [Paenibacillus sp. 481]